ncbi:DUF2868 domain-containing protein [Desulfopila sp. IMCC35008]|uniref:DUF2868 domain-containing protein n=1 Tax=Desulfopila sp. IMCC35008 TaxID=2653858 RepID=UPI0013D16F07|nr:DUF2868 domain-containing protein [Desulfopila sp. IMCC35008]
MKTYWNYKDSINLEYFIQLDEETDDAELHERDRSYFLQLPAELQNKERISATRLLRAWMDTRAAGSENTKRLPGTIAVEIMTMLRLVLVFFALVAGFGAGVLYFSYSGDTPVNVLPFCAIFVLFQLLLVLLLLFRRAVTGTLGKAIPRSAAVMLVSLLADRLYQLVAGKTRQTLGGSRLQQIQSVDGQARSFFRVHATIFYWPLFSLLQGAAVIFNVGLLAATFLKISVSDVAFGWQSTLQLSGQTLHKLAGWIALPWSWFLGEGMGYPTLTEVEGSRIILKEGIAHLATENLISWWPFLLMCVLVYSLLPRLLLYLYGRYREQQDDLIPSPLPLKVEQIIRRMQTPVVTTQAPPEPRPESGEREKKASAPSNTSTGMNLLPIVVLLPDDCYDSCTIDELRSVLQDEGFSPEHVHRFGVDYDSDQTLLKMLGQPDHTFEAGFLIIVESWMPPLMDFLVFLKTLRAVTGPTVAIRIRMLGRPDANTIFTPVTDAGHNAVWHQKTGSLGDPYLEVLSLIPGSGS